MSTWHKVVILEGGPSTEKISPPDRPVDKPVVHFPDWWLMGEAQPTVSDVTLGLAVLGIPGTSRDLELGMVQSPAYIT